MNKVFDHFFPDPKIHQLSLARALDITDFVVSFYKDYVSSRMKIYGNIFPEVCYPLFLSINFHLLRSYVDSIDRKLYTQHQKKESSPIYKNFVTEVLEIETKTTKRVEDFVDLAVSKKKFFTQEKNLTKKDIAIDFGTAFIQCCDQVTAKFGPDSMGLMSAGFLESSLYCISFFVDDMNLLNEIYGETIEAQRQITLVLEEYKKNKLKLDVMEN